MGQRKTYKCTKCDYSVFTSAGKDCGFDAVVRTYHCKNCKEIVDVLIGEMGIEYSKELFDENMIRCGIFERSEFFTCPECGKAEHLKIWPTKTKPCPKCNGHLEVDPKGLALMWD